MPGSKQEAFWAVKQAEDAWGYSLMTHELTSVTADSSHRWQGIPGGLRMLCTSWEFDHKEQATDVNTRDWEAASTQKGLLGRESFTREFTHALG